MRVRLKVSGIGLLTLFAVFLVLPDHTTGPAGECAAPPLGATPAAAAPPRPPAVTDRPAPPVSQSSGPSVHHGPAELGSLA